MAQAEELQVLRAEMSSLAGLAVPEDSLVPKEDIPDPQSRK